MPDVSPIFSSLLLGIQFQYVYLWFLCFHVVTDSSGCLAVQSKVMKHVVQLGSMTEKGSTKIGGSTIAQLLGLLECSKAFHNIRLRHYIFCFLQVLAGR
jgi:transcription initiation factor TFIID subunit 2